jgi:hypothetical protein
MTQIRLKKLKCYRVLHDTSATQEGHKRDTRGTQEGHKRDTRGTQVRHNCELGLLATLLKIIKLIY